MNPAWSVVIFTVLAGFGQGLAVALATAVLGGSLAPDAPFLAVSLAAAVALLAGGLASSFLHLGHPRRAWRAAAMWRTSWLSREVIVLPAFVALLALWAALVWRGGPSPLLRLLPVLAIAAAVLLWFCTAMIYACIRFIQEWAHPLTVLHYALAGLSSGMVLAVALAAGRGESTLVGALAAPAVLATAAAAAVRVASLRRNAALRPRSTLQSATGIGAPRLVQVTMGFSGGSFNTREFFHGLAAAALRRVRISALLLGFLLPLLLALAGWRTGSAAAWAAAVLVQAPGLLAERWLFFAQARHPQNLYYQRIG